MKKVSVVIVGAGGRGQTQGYYISQHPEEAEVLAVCEPREIHRNRLADQHQVPQERRFRDWKDLLAHPKLADAALICTQDRMHRDPAVALADKGYHLLLEKPMAPTAEECAEIYAAAKRNGVILAVCHVLRYTPFNLKLKQMIDCGVIGRVHNVQLLEPVGYWHMGHSFVRGNWRNEALSAPMLLAKSCHDIDLLTYFIPSNCTRVSSFGHLSHFRPENQPVGAADRCIYCPKDVESTCPYSALKLYIRMANGHYNYWPVDVLTPIPTEDAVMEALRDGPYGRCAYKCDNDVVDHQVVNMEFDDGAVATFTMSAFNQGAGREIYIMGDQGTLRCSDAGIVHFDFRTDQRTDVVIDDADEAMKYGHGGGDYGLTKNFFAAVRSEDPSYITTGPDESLRSHLIVFAAEHARLNGTVETVAEWSKEFWPGQ